MEHKKLITEMRVRSIKDIFLEPTAPMEIPPYQRSYAWKREEIADFIGDLRRLYTHRESDTPQNHFLGGIVAYEEKLSGVPEKVYHIVDGQQRLITFLLLFSIMRKEYKSLRDKFKKANDQDFFDRAETKLDEVEKAFAHEESDYLAIKHTVTTLTASEADDGFLRMVMNFEEDKEDIQRESHNLIVKARRKIERDLIRELRKENNNDRDYLLALTLLLECVKNDCTVIFIVCPDLDDAYELFQVLNDRGKSLTDGDLLRAHSYKLVHDHTDDPQPKDEFLRQYWDEILSRKDSKVKHFLEQYYRVVTGASPQKRNLYRQYKDELFAKVSSVEEIKALVKDLRNKFLAFTQITEGEWPYESPDGQISKYDKYRLEVLIRILGLNNVSILLIAAHKLEQKDFRDLVEIIEKFFFRYRTICRGSPTKIGDTFGKFANKIYTDEFSDIDFSKELRELLEEDAGATIFKDNLRLNLVYGPGKVKQRIRFFLTFIEDHRTYFDGTSNSNRGRDKSKIHTIDQSTTIEHIFPQNPKKGQGNSEITENTSRGDLTNCIGNLTFLAENDNLKLGNQAYASKRPEYRKSSVWLNRHIAEQEEWTEKEILARENELLNWGEKLFRV